MNRVDVIIPTCKEKHELVSQYKDILDTKLTPGDIIYTCTKASAAINRNIGLNATTSNIVIMIDDDIEGFFPGWDLELIRPINEVTDTFMSAARLFNPNGSIQVTLGTERMPLTPPFIDAEHKQILSACIAFIKTELRFDENYIGSGFEDTDFCKQMVRKFPNGRIIVNNMCKLIHRNERKNQLSNNNKNYEYFLSKWR